jgi:hypothetical protein
MQSTFSLNHGLAAETRLLSPLGTKERPDEDGNTSLPLTFSGLKLRDEPRILVLQKFLALILTLFLNTRFSTLWISGLAEAPGGTLDARVVACNHSHVPRFVSQLNYQLYPPSHISLAYSCPPMLHSKDLHFSGSVQTRPPLSFSSSTYKSARLSAFFNLSPHTMSTYIIVTIGATGPGLSSTTARRNIFDIIADKETFSL